MKHVSFLSGGVGLNVSSTHPSFFPSLPPSLPPGIITLEDVIEEILQEEILDEHDRSREELERRRQRGTKQVGREGGGRSLF